VDYSFLIMAAMVKTLERLEVQQGMDPAAFPPPIFDGSGVSICCFGVFIVAPPLFESRENQNLYSWF
jgi:hypothetical protein